LKKREKEKWWKWYLWIF